MDNIAGNVLQRNLSKVFPNKLVANATEVLFIMLMGMAAITLHAKLRIPMHLPGKQGIIFMLLVVMTRSVSKFGFASSLFCFSSALLLFTNALGFEDPFMPLVYILMGIVMDILFRINSRFSQSIILTAFFSGLCWLSIPVFRLLLGSFFGFKYLSFSGGLIFPFFTHFIFGFAGGIAGAAIIYSMNKRSASAK